MTRYWTAVLVLALAAFSQAHDLKNVTDHEPVKPSPDPATLATVIIGVIATTTLSVLILLIPTLIYYKLKQSREDELITIKK